MAKYARAFARVDIEIVRGDHLDFDIDLEDVDGNTVDISTYEVTARAIGCDTKHAENIDVKKNVSSINIKLTPDQTTAMNDKSEYDIQFEKSPDQVRVTPVGGIIKLSPEVTT